MISQQSIRAAFILIVLSSFTALIGIRLCFTYMQERQRFFSRTKDYASKELTHATKKLHGELIKIVELGDKFATALSLDNAQLEKVLDEMKNAAGKADNIASLGVGYQQYALGKHTRFFAQEYVHTYRGAEHILLEKFYDYTGATWFKKALENGKSWSDPYFSVVLNTTVVSYCSVITRFDKEKNADKPIGVVFVELTLADIARLVEGIDLQYADIEFLLSRDGTYLFHPNTSLVTHAKKIFDVAHEPGQDRLASIGTDMLHHETGYSNYYDPKSSKEYWVYYSPVDETGWSLGLMVEKFVSLSASPLLKKTMIQILLCISLFIFFMILLLTGAYKGNQNKLWFSTSFFAMMMIGTVLCIWYLVMTEPLTVRANSTIITDNPDLQRFLRLQTKMNQQMGKPSIAYIPTNLYISSIDFQKRGSASIEGYIWQVYDKQEHKKISRGVRISNATRLSINQAYHEESPYQEVLGYKFSADINARDTILFYPFDRQIVTLQLAHADFDSNVALVPYFDSWDIARLRAMLGLGDVKSTEWIIDKTVFSYALTNYDTNFGIPHFVRQKDFPELQYNILLHRALFDPIFSSLLPILIILFLMFGVILAVSPFEGEGTSVDSVLGMISSIFFSNIVAHQRFKSLIVDSREISYFEYFYFFCYVLILLVMLNSMILKLTKRFPWLRKNNNLIVKVSYWPIISMSVLLLTLHIFY